MTLKGRFDPRIEVSDVAVSQGTMEFNRTGNWRYLRPLSKEKLAPCRRLCPADTDIPRMLSLVAAGRHEEAYRLVRATNPLPAICGRVCYHPCELECTRKSIDEGIAVQGVERFLGELGLDLPEFVRMTLGTPDSGGRPRPVEVAGSNHFLEADSLIVAVGEEVDLGFCRRESTVVLGGDAATGPGTVVNAIASGRRGASEILGFLGLESTVPLVPALPTNRFSAEECPRGVIELVEEES